MLLAREGLGSPAVGLPPVQLRESSEGLDGGALVARQSRDQSSDGLSAHQAYAKRLRVAYVSAADPRDRRSWSGTHFRILNALTPYVADIAAIGPLHSGWRQPLAFCGKLSRSVFGKRYAHECSPLISADYGRQIERRLDGQHYDVILAPAASSEVCELKTRIPIVYLSDATFAQMQAYYPKFANMLPHSQKAGDAIESAAIRKAARVIYPSQWAAGSAVADYHADPRRVVEIPFGANFDVAPGPCARPAPPSGRCRMLFVGKGWARKGGPLALQALAALRARGIDATLTVVGCERPAGLVAPGAEFIANIDKRAPGGEQRLRDLYEAADVFVLPTRAECYGVVFCEAASYGLPIVATDTGGVASAVAHGGNGLLLPLEAGAKDYADAIETIVGHAARYMAMAGESRRLFETRLNWDVFGRRCAEVLHDAVTERQALA